MTKKLRRYQIVAIWPQRKRAAAERERAAEAAASDPDPIGIPVANEVDRSEPSRISAELPPALAASAAADGKVVPAGWFRLSPHEPLIRIGRDDTKGYVRQRLVSPFGRDG